MGRAEALPIGIASVSRELPWVLDSASITVGGLPIRLDSQHVIGTADLGK
jgi:hypothetical protein